MRVRKKGNGISESEVCVITIHYLLNCQKAQVVSKNQSIFHLNQQTNKNASSLKTGEPSSTNDGTQHKMFILEQKEYVIRLRGDQLFKALMDGNRTLICQSIAEHQPEPIVIRGSHLLSWIKLNGEVCIGLISERPGKDYGLPGGKIERGETLQHALDRELEEEMAHPPVLGLGHKFYFSISDCRNFECYYVVQNKWYEDLLYVPFRQIQSIGIDRYVSRVLQDAGVTESQSPRTYIHGKEFREGSFNPYGNGQPFLVTKNLSAGLVASATTTTMVKNTLKVRRGDVIGASVTGSITLVAATSGGTYGAIYVKKNATTPSWTAWNGSWDPSLYWPIAYMYASTAIAGLATSAATSTTLNAVQCPFDSDDAVLEMSFTTDATTVTPAATWAFTVLSAVSGPVSQPSSLQDVRLTDIELTGQNFPLWTSDTRQSPDVVPNLENTVPLDLTAFEEALTDSQTNVLLNQLRVRASALQIEDPDSSCLVYLNLFERAMHTGDDEAIALAWNGLMHALNGNTALVASMYDPVSQQTIQGTFDAKTGQVITGLPLLRTKKSVVTKPTKRPAREEPLEEEDTSAVEERYLRAVQRLGPVVHECVVLTLHPEKEWSLARRFKDEEMKDNRPKSREGSGAKGDKKFTSEEKTAKKQQLEQVVERLLKKLTTYDLALEWIFTSSDRVSDDLMLTILAKLNSLQQQDTASSFFLNCMVNRRPTYERLVGLSQYSSFVSKIVELAEFRDWMKQDFSIFTCEIDDNDEWEMVKAGRRSREMHAANGNIHDDAPPGWSISHDAPTVGNNLFGFLLDRLAFVLSHDWTGFREELDVKDSFLDRLLFFSDAEEKHEEYVVYGSRMSLAKLRNKMMHAANGNTERQDFPNDMKQLLEHQKTKALFTERETLSGKNVANPINEVQQQSGLMQIQGVNLSDVPREMPIRGGIVSNANALQNTNDLNHPEALLYPRTVRNGLAAALINSVQRLKLFGIGQQRRMNKFGMEISPHGAGINEITLKSGNVRPNQTTAFGFFTSEIVSLLKQQGDDNGDSLASFFTKLHLYSASVAWASPVSSLPISMEVGKFDAFTVVNPAPVVTLGYNDSPVFGEDCGGALAPVFPYTNAVPRISFHASDTTVPDGWTKYYVRGSILQQNDTGNNAFNLAQIAMGLAPYPCGIHTVTINTQDSAGGNAANQVFVPFSSCVHIPGATDIAFILPVLGSGDPPRNQINANTRVLVPPTAGPTAYGAIAANAALNVNFDVNPAALISYDLASYLGTWLARPASPVDLTSLNRLEKQVAELTARGKDMMFANELAVVNAVRYPPLVEAVIGVNTIPAVNSAMSVAHQNFFAQLPHSMTVNVPEQQSLFDFYIPELNVNFWNKTMTGCFQGISDGEPMPFKNYLMDASPRWLQYAIHIARDYAITAEYIFQYHRQSAFMWNSIFTQNNMVQLMVTLRKYFAASDNNRTQNAIIQSAAGKQVAVMHWKVNGEAPACDMWGLSVWSYINAPRVGFSNCWSVAGAEITTPIPSILPDIWSQLFTKKRTLAFAPFISPLKKMIGIQEPGCQVTALGAGSYTIPASVESQAREVGLNTVPIIDDVEVFNARLVYHMFLANLYTLDGNIWAISTLTPPNLLCQKYCREDYTVPDLILPSIPMAKTNWMPYNSSTGLRLLTGVTAANNANLMSQIMDGRAFATLSTWVFNKVTVMPNTIIGTVGNTDDGLWGDEGEEALNTSSGSLPVKLLEVVPTTI